MSKVITISREYGSGGRDIGKMVAEKLNIPFYDKESILSLCKNYSEQLEEFDFDSDQSQGSKNPVTYFLNVISSSFGSDVSINDQIFLMSSQIIHKLAKQDCVIIGRCADYILKDHENTLKVFIHANYNDRVNRAIENYGDEAESIKEKIKRIDKNRATYYQFYTEHKWGDMHHIDLSINTSLLSIEQSANLIIEAYKRGYK